VVTRLIGGDERLSVDPPRALARQEEHDVGEVLGPPEAVRRGALHDGVADRFVLREGAHRVAVDHAAGDGVHPDAAGCELDRQVTHDVLERRLADADRAVERNVAVAAEARERDDLAAGLGEEPERLAGEEQESVRVGAERHLPLRGAHPEQRLEAADGGVVDDGVEPRAARPDALEHLLHVVRVADVGRDRIRDAAPVTDLGAGLERRALVAQVVDDDVRPGLGEAEGDRAADAARSPGHQHGLAGELHVLTGRGRWRRPRPGRHRS
jgi:hypothetical protein